MSNITKPIWQSKKLTTLFNRIESKQNIFLFSNNEKLLQLFFYKFIHYQLSNLKNEDPEKILLLFNKYEYQNQVIENLKSQRKTYDVLKEFVVIKNMSNFSADIGGYSKDEPMVNKSALTKLIYQNNIDMVCFNELDLGSEGGSYLDELINTQNLRKLILVNTKISISDIRPDFFILNSNTRVSSFTVHYLNKKENVRFGLFNINELL